MAMMEVMAVEVGMEVVIAWIEMTRIVVLMFLVVIDASDVHTGLRSLKAAQSRHTWGHS